MILNNFYGEKIRFKISGEGRFNGKSTDKAQNQFVPTNQFLISVKAINNASGFSSIFRFLCTDKSFVHFVCLFRKSSERELKKNEKVIEENKEQIELLEEE